MEADLLIINVTVMDGTGAPGFKADVAVAGGRVRAVGELGKWRAARTVSAPGRVLCPGFVDMHGHSDYYLVSLPTAESKLRQGVTTEVAGNCGYSAAPVRGQVALARKTEHKEMYGLEVDWADLDQHLDRLDKSRPAINFVPLVGFNTVREAVMGMAAGPADVSALAEMKTLIRESLQAGAFGMSLGLIYPPGSFAELAEIVECAKEVSAVGGLVSSHMRSEGDRLIEAVQESIAIARQAQVRFQISHLKTAGPANWGKLGEVFALIEAAQAEGLVVRADRYPYIASSTQLSAALPDWVFEGGQEKFFARLADSETRNQVREKFKHKDPPGERWKRIVIAQTAFPELAHFEGQSVAEAAAKKNLEPLDFLCWIVVASRDRSTAIYHTMTEDNLRRIYQRPWVMIGSDSAVMADTGPLSQGLPHPRSFGTMPRVLGWVARDQGWLDLPAAIRKMTLDPCQMLGLSDRGQIKEGMVADLALFDPARVRDRATYDNPKQYPEGVEMVVVNGKIALENGKLAAERAGQVLRRKT